MIEAMLLILDIESSGFDSDVILNGIPVAEERALTTNRRAIKINGWAINGDNLLEVRLKEQHPGSDDAPEPRFGLLLRRASPGASTDKDETLLEYSWSSNDQPLTAGQTTTVLKRKIALQAPKTWSWVRAPALQPLGEQDRSAIVSLLRSVERSLADKKPAEVVAFQTLSLTEQAQATGSDPAQVLEHYSSFLSGRMLDSGWQVESFAEDALEFIPLAAGRLYHIRTTSGQPPLVARTTDSQFMIDPYVAKVDGSWAIVR